MVINQRFIQLRPLRSLTVRSKFDEILITNSKNTSRAWRQFAKRTKPIYCSEQDNWGALAYGYKSAADILAEHQINERMYRPELFPAVFFLYRHYFELELKSTWRAFYERGQLPGAPPEHEHRISQLWPPIKDAVVRDNLATADDPLLLRVDKSMSLVNSIDATSVHSRYPEIQGQYHTIHISFEELVCAADDFETLVYALYEIARARYEVDV
jgi:hypothetical protein